MNESIKLNINDLNFDVKLTARSHGKALRHLIEKDIFADDAIIEIKTFYQKINEEATSVQKQNSKAKIKKISLGKQLRIEKLLKKNTEDQNKSVIVDLSSDSFSESSESEDDLVSN